MRRYFIGLLALILFGCAPSKRQRSRRRRRNLMPKAASLPDLGPAPELTNDTWLNVDSPLRLADLRGKVVLLDMWTFG
jgi:hypothetical protein